MTGRPKMLRASDFPGLLAAAAAAKNAGATLGETLEALTWPLIAIRCDDRVKVLRAVLDLFNVARELRPGVLVTFGIFPSREKPRKRRGRKLKRECVRDPGPRRHCRYGEGAYVRDATAAARP